uniref:Uncharacterized protein n=1 Tax=Oryza sativa subsp. japonica TaxID=39947 RepID=Q6EPB9_ORYSJ|nr:hypothetical protein [Oryza sativa Japonica Group]
MGVEERRGRQRRLLPRHGRREDKAPWWAEGEDEDGDESEGEAVAECGSASVRLGAAPIWATDGTGARARSMAMCRGKERHNDVFDLAGCRFEEEGYSVVDYESALQTAKSTTVI